MKIHPDDEVRLFDDDRYYCVRDVFVATDNNGVEYNLEVELIDRRIVLISDIEYHKPLSEIDHVR